MPYWRMQLHPNEPLRAAFYTVNSLANGFIGLDFAEDTGDLTKLDVDSLETQPNNIRAFIYELKSNDWVLIFLHHQPFALVTDIGEYNYIKNLVSELNIWFRHFRKVKKIYYYSDVFGKIQEKHSVLKMTNTFSGVSSDTESGNLINEWKNNI